MSNKAWDLKSYNESYYFNLEQEKKEQENWYLDLKAGVKAVEDNLKNISEEKYKDVITVKV